MTVEDIRTKLALEFMSGQVHHAVGHHAPAAKVDCSERATVQKQGDRAATESDGGANKGGLGLESCGRRGNVGSGVVTAELIGAIGAGVDDLQRVLSGGGAAEQGAKDVRADLERLVGEVLGLSHRGSVDPLFGVSARVGIA